MNKTSIEWCDYTVNPVKGLCPVDCKDLEGKPYCYARRMYKRFKWDETIRYDPSGFDDLSTLPGPSTALQHKRIFIGSTMELFGPWVKREWMADILDWCRFKKEHTFIFLTKRPQELQKYNPWPDNCWVGASICDDKMLDVAVNELEDVQASIKFLSFEPLLERLTLSLDYAIYYGGVSWVIIGQQTPARKPIPASWIADIEMAADKVGIPVFHKNNLGIRPEAKRQEWPKGR
jgi:protein gp37